ncbi:MAG: FMN-binding protein [Prevotella sp.]|nr:FMN-binding protein [Prevotella sp.]
MKKVISILALFSLVIVLSSAKGDDGVMTKENGMYVVNTTTLGKNVVGYVAATPLKIYIQKDKIVKVEALKNQETPKYNAKVKRMLLTKWDGMKVKDVAKQKVDGVTGATITSDAMKKNVQLGVEYYLKNK